MEANASVKMDFSMPIINKFVMLVIILAKPAAELHRMNAKAVTRLCLEQSMVLNAHVWMVTF